MFKSIRFSLLLILFCQFAYAQVRQVSGTVKDESTGELLPGVAVVEKGTSNGTVTDMNGVFSLNLLSENPILVISGMGVKAMEIAVTSENMDISMKAETSQLDEVVVTALGISKEKKTLGYAVTNLSGDEIRNSGEQNIIQSLAAKAPGVQVIGSGGTPGSSSKILIRGNSTFTGENQPLIVIDGIPIDNSTTQSSPRDYPFNPNLKGVNNSNRAIDINPQDIESVTVLKGPAAAALYGARAGNGAIIYTTKRGKRGKELGVRVSSSVEFSQVNKLPERQRKYGAGLGGNFISPADSGPDGIFGTNDDIASGTQQSWGPKLDTTNIQSYNNEENFFQTGVAFNNNVEVSGGTGKASVRLSIGDLRQTGVMPNTNFNRTSVRLTGDADLSSKLRVGGTATYVSSSSTMAQNGSNLAGTMLGLLRAPNTYDLRDYQNSQGYQNTYFFIYDNPYYTANENPFTSKVNRVMGNVFANYTFNDSWSTSYRIGADAYGDQRKQIFAISSWGDDIGTVGQINENRVSNRQIYGDWLLNYNTKLNEQWKLKATLGHNFFITEFDDVFARGRQLTVPSFYNLSNATDLYASSYAENQRTTAWFGELSLEAYNQLYLTFTGRNEWASSYELTAKNSFLYPSAQASWVFTEYLGDKTPKWLNFGKLRYSYAMAGIPPVPYGTRTYYNTPTYTDGFTNGLTFPYGGQNGSAISGTLGNDALKPERVIGNEVGMNVVILDGLLDIDVTYYNQKSVDILLFRPLATSSGYEDSYENSGEMVNKGWEVYIDFKPIREEDYSWTIGLNWSMNKSEILKLAEGVEEVNLEAAFGSIQSFAIVGQPYGAFYGSRWARNSAGQQLIGANGRPQLDAQTGNVGNPQPDWLAGLRNSFRYKNWGMTFLLDFRKGGSIWNGTWARLNQYGITIETEDREREYIVDGVYAPGTVINGVDVSGQANATGLDARTYFRSVRGDAGGAVEDMIEDVNWVRLRDLTLSYHLPIKSEKTSIDYVDFKFTGRNLWLSTNYRGVDPETSLTGAGSNVGGFDYFNNPGTRSYMFGVSFGL